MSQPQQLVGSEKASAALVALAQTAIGAGVGMLVAGKLARGGQRSVAAALLALGAAAAVPVIYDLIVEAVGGPETSRGLRKRLQSIRGNGDVHEDVEVY